MIFFLLGMYNGYTLCNIRTYVINIVTHTHTHTHINYFKITK